MADMKAQADAHISYELNAAEILKKQGNELHCQGKFHDDADKYMRVKNNLTDIPGPKSRTLQIQCSLNLMSCYLKTNQYDHCINEGSKVLAYDSNNVKALYRRGQAYKELGNLKAAVADLEEAYKASPDDETIAYVLRDTEEKLLRSGDGSMQQGVVEEKEEEEENEPTSSGNHTDPSVKYSVTRPVETTESSQKVYGSDPGTSTVDAEYLKSFSNNPEVFRAFQNSFLNADPDTLASMNARGMSPDMMKTAADMMSKMKPEELQKIFEIGSSSNRKSPSSNGNSSGFGSSKFPEITPELAKQASDMMSKMSPEELQRVHEVDSSFNGSNTQFSAPPRTPTADNPDARSRMGQSSSSFPTSTADLQENLENSMNEPVMQQVFTSMMKNMSPEMMASMCEQFRMQLSKEEAAIAQRVLSSLSPEDSDIMLNMPNFCDNVEGAPSDKRKGSPNKRWTEDMDNVLIPLLADMARSGLKVDKSFKRQAFVEAANIVNSKYPAACVDADNVENHMHTLKQKYQDIKKLMNLNGIGWNDSEQVLVLEDEMYRAYVEGQPKAKEYLNKHIPFFDELHLVVGDDYTTSDHARTIHHQFGGTNLEENNTPSSNKLMDYEPLDTSKQRHEVPWSSASKTTARTGHTSKTIGENVAIEHLLDKLGQLVSSIVKSKQTWKEKLSDALWSMEGYSDEDLDMVFEELIVDKSLAESFYLRKPSLRQRWLNDFIAHVKVLDDYDLTL
ncbi:putative peptidylprolyl isomerase [Dioscorea sansibarensis]